MKTNQYNEPDVIFLQLHDPTDEGKTELADPKADGVTWCWEQIHHNDVEYIRKDLYDELKNQITVYQLTIENMEAERDRLVPAAVRGNNGYVKAKRDFPDIDSFLKACRDNTTLYEIEDKS